MRAYAKICVILLALSLLLCGLSACTENSEAIDYANEPHTHIFGYWYDVALTEGEDAPRQVRYCRICHAEDVRVKE